MYCCFKKTEGYAEYGKLIGEAAIFERKVKGPHVDANEKFKKVDKSEHFPDMKEVELDAAYRIADGKSKEGDLETIAKILFKGKKAKLHADYVTIQRQEDEKEAEDKDRKCKLFATEKEDAVVVIGASRSKLVIFYMELTDEDKKNEKIRRALY